jgi:RecA/RadA recombinase
MRDAAALLADESGEGGPFRVMIIDSIIALYRQARARSLRTPRPLSHRCRRTPTPVWLRAAQEFPGRGELAERQQRMGKVLAQAKEYADIFNLAVIITNQVCADPGQAASFVQDAKKAVGGHIVAHLSDTRVSLRKGKGDQRVAQIVQHPMQPPAEAAFSISNGGVGPATD